MFKHQIFLKIADFYIKLNFHPTNFTVYIESAKKFLNYIKNFSSSSAPSKFDYQININVPDNNLIRIFPAKANKEEYYILFFKEKREVIQSYYYLSPAQYFLLVHHSVIQLLRKRQDFIIHASAVSLNQNAFLFSGKEGIGKTTIKNFLRKVYPEITDDSAIIRFKNNSFFTYQVPFLDRTNPLSKDGKRRYEVKKIFFLKQSSYFKLIPIKNKKHILELLKDNLILPASEQNLLKFSKKIEFFQLLFPNNKDLVLKNIQKLFKLE